jgi:FkbM family methyltransferase
VKVFSLQFDETEEERAIGEQAGITSLARSLGDFANTAAVVLRLDVVITIDTSIAHLAGALGVPVWVLLEERPDWRWVPEHMDASPWYPTMRLFRQQPSEARSVSIRRARATLADLAQTPPVSRPNRRRRLQRFEARGIELLAYDERWSSEANFVAQRLIDDGYALEKVPFRPGDVVIDTGAHVGLVSIYLAKRHRFLRIYAFEPSLTNFQNCKDNVVLNGVRRIRLSEAAVTGDGHQTMVPCNHVKMDVASTSGDVGEGTLSGTAMHVTLDQVLANVLLPEERCRFLKISCKGLERDVLTRSELLHRVDYLAVECHQREPHGHELLEYCSRFIDPTRIHVHN